jgi:FlaA1/EpsC-like NDP-sugar epimerase
LLGPDASYAPDSLLSLAAAFPVAPLGASIAARVDRLTTGLQRHAHVGITDAVVVALSYLLVMLVRFEGRVPPESLTLLAVMLPFLAALYVGCNMVAGVYWREWRYATIDDAALLLMPVGVTTVLLSAVTLSLPGQRFIPLSVYLTASLVAYLGMVTAKVLPQRLEAAAQRGDRREKVLVAGNGRAAHDLVLHLLRHGRGYVPVAVVSDTPGAEKIRFHGLRNVGRINELRSLIQDLEIDVVAVAMPDAPRSEIRRVVDQCLATDARIRFAPDLDRALDGKASPDDFWRAAGMEDFLGRKAADTEVEACRSYIVGRTVLITGAAGSIGSEISRQVARLSPSRLILFDTNETGLFDLTNEIEERVDHPETMPVVGSVEDPRALSDVFSRGIDVVFHTAAYKHVSLMESQPAQAIMTNVVGTRNVVRAACGARVDRFVFISTDKAVMPNNVMGASKRLGEAVVHGMGRAHGITTAVVRFGNVLGSRGSVLPIFERQIQHGGPVTVTDPDVRRYFMTIPEAAMLVIHAGILTEGNDTFLLRMGEEMSIDELAHKLIRLRGYRVGQDIEIVYTGLKPGEKLFEELTYPQETTLATEHPDIFLVRGEVPDGAAVDGCLYRLVSSVSEDDVSNLRALLMEEATALFAPRVPAPALP